VQEVIDLNTSVEKIASGPSTVYWQVPIGQSTSTIFAKRIAAVKYKAVITTRNLNTLEAMLTALWL